MATKTVLNVSPKVFTGGLCGLGVAVVEAITVAVTPHSLSFLGTWEPLALAAVPPLLGQVAAWFKKEQAAVSHTVAPPAVDVPQAAPVAPTAAAAAPIVPQTADQIIAGVPAA